MDDRDGRATVRRGWAVGSVFKQVLADVGSAGLWRDRCRGPLLCWCWVSWISTVELSRPVLPIPQNV